MRLRTTGGLGAALCTLLWAGISTADSGLDTPENGVVQLGRGSAWVAKADDPLAAYYNPAGLVLQGTSVHVGVQVMALNECFSRLGPGGQPVSPGGGLPAPGTAGGPPAAVCNGGAPFPNPQVAAAFRLTDRLAVGIAVLGPHAAGNQSWPDSVSFTNKFGVTQTEPSPQRYMLVSSNSLILDPTVSVGYAVNDELSVGAGFIWGIASVDFTNFAQVLSSTPPNYQNDVKAEISGKDLFIPGFVLGAMWHPTPRLDLGASFKWQDAIDIPSANIALQANYWQSNGKPTCPTNPTTGTNIPNAGPVIPANCPANSMNITNAPGAADIRVAIPAEARLGIRYHKPRAGGTPPAWATQVPGRRVRDSLSEDKYDLEMDFSWAGNSALQAVQICTGGAKVSGSGCTAATKPIAVTGTTSTVPTNAYIPHDWTDSGGVRLGGDYIVLPSRLALRAGGFFETGSMSSQYLNVDFLPTQRGGLSGGGTVRLGAVDVSAAYQHTFYATVDNGGQGAVHALSGDAATGYRSSEAVNGGKLTASLNEVGVSGTMHF
jgi:long-subunit fatty acid transport protein